MENIIKEIDYETFIKIVSEIPSCIFFKDKDLKYRFSTHHWEQLIDADIVGKTDLEVRKDIDNAKLATECDLNIIRTGKGCNYIIKSDIDGNITYIEVIKEPVFNTNGEIIGLVGLLTDVTERTIMQNRIDKLLTIDSLTGVYNRHTGTDMITKSLNDGKTNKALCLLDINKFKYINDTYGHQIGDKVLKEFGETLKTSVRPGDIVMRLGGDEFIVFLVNISTKDQAKGFVNKLAKNIVDKINIEELQEDVTISVGIQFVEEDSDFDSLYAKADKNMYEAKRDDSIDFLCS